MADWLFRYRFVFVGLVALTTRVVFVDGSLDWFDSTQYLVRSQDPDFIHALSTGHGPFHPGYILWTWLAVKLFLWTGAAPAYLIGLTTALFGSGALVVFFRLAERWTNARTAAIATFLAGLTPFFWVGSLGILIDPVMIFWYLLSLLCFDLALERVGKDAIATRDKGLGAGSWELGKTLTPSFWSLASGFALGLAMLAHTQIALWSLGFAAVLIVRWPWVDARRQTPDVRDLNASFLRLSSYVLAFAIGPILAITAYLYLLVHAGHNASYGEAFKYLLGGNAGDHAPFGLGFAWRNWSAVAGSTLAIVSLGALGWLLAKPTRLSWALLVWFLPGVIVTSAYLYSNLFGRSTIVAIFPATIAVGTLLVWLWEARRRHLSAGIGVGLVVALVTQSGPLVAGYAVGPSTGQEQGDAQRQLAGYFIQSPENVTLRGSDDYDVVSVQPKNTIEARVKGRLSKGAPVYIPMDSLIYPYAKIDGRNVRIDSVDFGGDGQHGSQLAWLADLGALRLAQIPASPLKWATYELVPTSITLEQRVTHAITLVEASKQQAVSIGRFQDAGRPISRLLIDTYRRDWVASNRFDTHDWLARLAAPWRGYKDPAVWGYTDRDGFVELVVPNHESRQLSDWVASTDRIGTAQAIQAETGQSVATDHRYYSHVANTDSAVAYESAEALLAAVRALPTDQSALVKIEWRDDRIQGWIARFGYTLPLTNLIEAEDLSLSPAATIVEQPGASEGNLVQIAAGAAGTAVFGPYRTLPAGHYRLEYALDVPVTADETWELAKLQVAGELEGKHFATTEPVTVFDVRQGSIALDFTLEKPTEFLEFRLLPLGSPTSFTLDTLRLIRR